MLSTPYSQIVSKCTNLQRYVYENNLEILASRYSLNTLRTLKNCPPISTPTNQYTWLKINASFIIIQIFTKLHREIFFNCCLLLLFQRKIYCDTLCVNMSMDATYTWHFCMLQTMPFRIEILSTFLLIFLELVDS